MLVVCDDLFYDVCNVEIFFGNLCRVILRLGELKNIVDHLVHLGNFVFNLAGIVFLLVRAYVIRQVLCISSDSCHRSLQIVSHRIDHLASVFKDLESSELDVVIDRGRYKCKDKSTNDYAVYDDLKLVFIKLLERYVVKTGVADFYYHFVIPITGPIVFSPVDSIEFSTSGNCAILNESVIFPNLIRSGCDMLISLEIAGIDLDSETGVFRITVSALIGLHYLDLCRYKCCIFVVHIKISASENDHGLLRKRYVVSGI